MAICIFKSDLAGRTSVGADTLPSLGNAANEILVNNSVPSAFLPMISRSIGVPSQGAWQDQGIVLTAGPSGSWDVNLDGAYSPCSVVKMGNKYFLYYIGADGYRSTDGGPRKRALGVATSNDGVNFRKYGGNPIIRYLPNNNQEEGVFSCGATLDGGTVVLYYGAIRARNATSTSVDVDIRMRYSNDGLTFVGDVLIRRQNSDELTPLGAIHMASGWYVYYVGPLSGGKGDLKLLSGLTRTSLPNSHNVLNGSFNSGGDPIRLSPADIVLFIQSIGGSRRPIEVRTADVNNMASLSGQLEKYDFGPGWGHTTVFFDDSTGKWFMFYRYDDAQVIRLKTVG